MCDAFLLSVCAIPPLLALALTLPLLAAGVFAARDSTQEGEREGGGESTRDSGERERARARKREREQEREKERNLGVH